MKLMNRILASLLLCLVLVSALAPTASAAGDALIEITGKKNTFVFHPGSKDSATDLFPNFKNLFPGDTVIQKVFITHKAPDLGSFHLYMRAVPHSLTNLPQDSVLKHEGTVDAMNDFLSQLELNIYKGASTDVTPIYASSPDKPGALSEFVELGVFKKGATGLLTVELTVPLTMGNDYADRMGEVDWEFMIEEIPPAIIPQTGDQSNVHIMIAVSCISFGAIVVVLILMLKKKKK